MTVSVYIPDSFLIMPFDKFLVLQIRVFRICDFIQRGRKK